MQMDEITQQNAALVEEAAAASQAMVEQAQALNGMIAGYQVGAEEHAPSAPLKSGVVDKAAAERRKPARPWTKPAARTADARAQASGAALHVPAARKAAASGGKDDEWKEF